MRYATLLIVLACLGCTTISAVQALAEPYSVEASATISDPATGATVVKGVWLNARYIAVDLSEVSGAFVLRGPAVYGGPIVELRRFDKTTGGGRQVWEIVLPKRAGEKTQLVASTWAAARASMPHMPA